METKNIASKWSSIPTELLISQIETRFHKPLLEKIPVVQDIFDKVLRQHGAKELQLEEIYTLFCHFSRRMPIHLLQEEQILFPLLKQLEKNPSLYYKIPFQEMIDEHTRDLKLIQELRRLTNDFTPPPQACQTWTKLYSELKTLFSDLEIHIRLENEILFGRFHNETSHATEK